MEDDLEVASLYSSVLEDRGHIVTLGCTAEECLKSTVKAYKEHL